MSKMSRFSIWNSSQNDSKLRLLNFIWCITFFIFLSFFPVFKSLVERLPVSNVLFLKSLEFNRFKYWIFLNSIPLKYFRQCEFKAMQILELETFAIHLKYSVTHFSTFVSTFWTVGKATVWALNMGPLKYCPFNNSISIPQWL